MSSGKVLFVDSSGLTIAEGLGGVEMLADTKFVNAMGAYDDVGTVALAYDGGDAEVFE